MSANLPNARERRSGRIGVIEARLRLLAAGELDDATRRRVAVLTAELDELRAEEASASAPDDHERPRYPDD